MECSRVFVFKVGRILSLSLFILLILTVAVRAYSIGNHTMCKDIDKPPTPDEPIDPTNTFYDTDQQVCLLVILENVDRSYNVYTKWLTPDGDLSKKDDYATPDAC